jgi:hypothetical protein
MEEPDALAMWAWYEAGGLEAVAYYLRTLDLTGFNPKAPPLRTAWWHQLVAGGASQEEDRFSDALDKLQRPEWTTIAAVGSAGGPDLTNWMASPGNNRKLERAQPGRPQTRPVVRPRCPANRLPPQRHTRQNCRCAASRGLTDVVGLVGLVCLNQPRLQHVDSQRSIIMEGPEGPEGLVSI